MCGNRASNRPVVFYPVQQSRPVTPAPGYACSSSSPPLLPLYSSATNSQQQQQQGCVDGPVDCACIFRALGNCSLGVELQAASKLLPFGFVLGRFWILHTLQIDSTVQ